MMAWLSPARWLLLLSLAGSLWLAYGRFVDHQQAIGEQRATDRYELALKDQKAKADHLLATETAKVRAREAELKIVYVKQEATDAQNQTTVAAYERRLRDLRNPAGQLRDPNATAARCGQGGAGPADAVAATAGAGTADPAQAGGLLSLQLSDLLGRLLRESDAINIAYASCRADAYAIRALLPP